MKSFGAAILGILAGILFTIQIVYPFVPNQPALTFDEIMEGYAGIAVILLMAILAELGAHD